MKTHQNKQLNDDKCKVHTNNNKKYKCYCFKCKKHLCKECLKSRTHLEHHKNNIEEIQPIEKELNIMNEIIKDYKNRVEELEKENKNFNKKLEESLKDKKTKLEKKFEEQNRKNKENKFRDINSNNEKFKLAIKEIKKRYEEEIKLKKIEYEENNNKIKNEYEKKYQKNKIIYESKRNKLDQKKIEEIERLGYDKKIEILKSIVKFNEIVYNTYKAYNQNYFNCINLNNLLINYYKNESIKNNVIKRILKDDYDKVTELILKRKGVYENEKESEEEFQKEKENDKIRKLEMENKKLKEQMEKQNKELELLRKQLEEKEKNQKTDQDMINKKEETKQFDQIISTNDSTLNYFKNNY